MTKTLRGMFGTATVVGLFMAAGSVLAAQNFPPMAAPGAAAEMSSPLKQLIGEAVQNLTEQERDWIATRMADRHIQLMEQQNGLQTLTPEERDQLATAMVGQKMPLLQEINSGISGSAEVTTRLMEKIRDKMIGDITGDIKSHNQALCRPVIQPHVTQGMISRIRPWEFPSRVQVNTIPMFTPKIIDQVNKHFKGNRTTATPGS